MNDSLVLFERVGPAAVLTLNRPEKRNALARALVAAIADRLNAAVADAAVRAVIVAANGPAFCAGLDLDELTETMRGANPRDQLQADARQLASLYRALATCPKPTIAEVNGPAVAGGAGLVTACDLAIATAAAKFGYPEVRRGIVPAIITPMLLSIVSDRVAKRLLLSGDLIEADEAARLGLYNTLVPADQLRATSLACANDIAAGAPETLAATKRWIDRAAGAADLWTESADASAAGRFTMECHEGLAAFREKRPPDWAPARQFTP